jgi:hypothetical protein
MHDLAEKCLKDPSYGWLSMALGMHGFVDKDGTVIYLREGAEDSTLIDEEFVEHTQVYVDFVRKMAMGGELLVEERLSIEHITDEEDAKGTSDSVIIFPEELCIVDLKGGFKKVFAKHKLEGAHYITAPKSIQQDTLFGKGSGYKPNTQLLMYAEAVREELSMFHEFKRVRIIIVMPRIGFIDEHVMDMEEFMTWVQWVREQAEATRSPDAKAFPHEDVCTYCKAWPCPEATQHALEIAMGDFDDIETAPLIDIPRNGFALGALKRKVPFLRKFCDAVDGIVHAELAQGNPVDGFKLVMGEEGDREWADVQLVTTDLVSMGLTEDQYTTRKMLGPAGIEKLVRGPRSKQKPLSEEQWEKLQGRIRRAPASPKVVPSDDPRSAMSYDAASDFDDDISQSQADQNADFF